MAHLMKVSLQLVRRSPRIREISISSYQEFVERTKPALLKSFGYDNNEVIGHNNKRELSTLSFSSLPSPHDKANELMDGNAYPVGSWKEEHLDEAVNALKELTDKKRTRESITLSFELAHRIIAEAGTRELEQHIMSTESLNEIIKSWSWSWRGEMAIKPADALRFVVEGSEASPPILKPDMETFILILELARRYCGKEFSFFNFVNLVVDKMKELSDAQGNQDIYPDQKLYNKAICDFARLRNGSKAEELLNKMIDEYKQGNHLAKPDIACFSSVINAWSKSNSPEGPKRAEMILRRIKGPSKEGILHYMEPNTILYNTVINTYAQAGDGKRAEEILQQMYDEYKQGNEEVKPSVKSYSSVINAYASVGRADKAEQILQQMYNAYNQGNEMAKPNTVAFNSVLKAWSRSKSKDAPYRAEVILQHMQQLSDSGTLYVKPNVISFSLVVLCWSNSGEANSAKRAESVLHRMLQSGYFNRICYNMVMNAYGKIGNVQKAEEILQELFNAYKKSGNPELKPNIRDFHSVLNAWAKSNSQDAPARVEAILNHMAGLYSSRTLNVKPNEMTYKIVMHCLAKSRRPDCGERVEAMLRRITDIQPTVGHYLAVINAYASVGDGNNAEKILEEMITKYQNDNSERLKPNSVCFNSTINAWTKSKQSDAADRANKIVARMEKLFETGVLNVMPNPITYRMLKKFDNEVSQ